jgi:hypothetical protein
MNIITDLNIKPFTIKQKDVLIVLFNLSFNESFLWSALL